jgi:hypothetical protein
MRPYVKTSMSNYVIKAFKIVINSLFLNQLNDY